MSAAINRWAYTIKGLHSRWEPNAGQQPVIDSIFFDGIRSAFVRCGRKWGKTEVAMYLLWRVAQSFPGMPCYYFTPQQNQARNIVWEDPRIKNFGPREWLKPGSRGISEGDMVLRFKNDSFIKIDGTDSFNKYRGPRYKIAVYDEYKDCDPRMRKAMRPNAAVYGGIDIFMGSPPEESNTDYETLDKEHQSGIDPTQKAFHAPSWHNPHVERKWLLDEKTRLYRRGDGHEWEREYGAKYVRGGANVIFPMLDDKMKKPHAEVMQMLYRDRKKLQWAWCADPAGATCFGVLFLAINPFTKQIYALDEIYETVQQEMTTKRIGTRIIQKRNELYDRASAWREIYDEAETWFLNEWIANFEFENGLEPSNKAKNDKIDGLGLLKDILLEWKMVISDRCEKFWWELESYQKDKNGKIPKKNDHLIDPARYILGNLFYELPKKHEPDDRDNPEFRGASLQSDLDKIHGRNEYEEI